MGRIGATLSGVERMLLNRLAEAETAAVANTLRLAAGKRVNTPADDVSTFVRLSQFQTQLTRVTATTRNVTAAESMVSQTQSTLGLIRTQLDAIRAELLTDEDQGLTSAERAEAQAKIDTAITNINGLAATTIDGRRILDGSADFNVSGRNGTQVADFVVHEVHGSTTTVSGSVDRAATRAQLVYTGSSARIGAGDGGNLTIAGMQGSVIVAVADDDLLTDVAVKINNRSHKTGITATAEGDTLTFSSVGYGSDATASVSSDSAFAVAGGNGDGTAEGSDMIATIGGITYSPAEAAELRHRESTGTFTADAEISVTGHLGSDVFSITNGDSLALVAATINAQRDSTGVEAEVDGNDLVLRSTIAGSDGRVDVEVTSGSFDTVTDYTAAAAAELIYSGADGELAADADFRLTGTGFFDFSFSAGKFLTDVADDINDETGTTGIEAVAQGDQLILRTVATGASASMSVTNVVGDFAVTGGNGDGTADGTNATASDTGVDKVTPNAALNGNRLSVNRNGTRFEVEFAGGFSGTFDTIEVSGDAMTFALGTDVRRRDRLAIPSVRAEYLGGISGKLSDLLGDGSAAGLGENTARAIRIVDEALADLTRIEGSVDGFYNAAITSSSNLLDAMQKHLEGDPDEGTEGIISQTDGFNSDLENLLLSKNQQLMANAEAGLAILTEQRMAIVDMIQQIAGLK